MQKTCPISVAEGDGIGPEIMQAVLHILKEGGAALDIEKVAIGESVYLSGHPTGIEESAWESLKRTRIFLKAPITTPQGGGYRSLNVTIRTAFGLYANIRPCVSYAPFIKTKHPSMDVVIVRENEEDLYVGIEYQQTPDVCQALKYISRPATEKICRYAFEYAKKYRRKKVTCFSKDNILKQSDGLFHTVFDEIAKEYSAIEHEHWIIDIGAAKLADTPENFDVIVMPNLYGDILSDIGAQITGSVGLVGTSNIGERGAMFEAIHGSAPKLAGEDRANPTGLLLAAIQMLVHIGQPECAARIHNAFLKAIEEGVHTPDLGEEGSCGTQQFAQEITTRLGKMPETLAAVSYGQEKETTHYQTQERPRQKRELCGVDIFLYGHYTPDELAKKLEELPLSYIANRGSKVWPEKMSEAMLIDHWRCRFENTQDIATLYQELKQRGLDIIKTENLYLFDGKPGYSA